jgi:hypothetical protein
MILNISSLGDNIYMCYNLCATHDGNSCVYAGICLHGEILYDCAFAKSMHTIAQSITNSSYKFGRFSPNSLNLNVRPACPHLPDSGYKHCPACTDWKGEVHATLNNIAISVIVSEAVNVFCYSFAGESCKFVKFFINRIKITTCSKKHNRNVPRGFVK